MRPSPTAASESGARAMTRTISSSAARIMWENGATSSAGRRPLSLMAWSMTRMAPSVRPSSMARHRSQPSTDGASTSTTRWMTGSAARSIQASAAVRIASSGSAQPRTVSVSFTVTCSDTAETTASNRASFPAKWW